MGKDINDFKIRGHSCAISGSAGDIALHQVRVSNDPVIQTPRERYTCVYAPRAVHACLRPESGFLDPKTCHIFENVAFSIPSRDRSCKKQVAYRLVIVAIRNRSLLSSTFRVVNRCLHVYIPSVIVAVSNAS